MSDTLKGHCEYQNTVSQTTEQKTERIIIIITSVINTKQLTKKTVSFKVHVFEPLGLNQAL